MCKLIESELPDISSYYPYFDKLMNGAQMVFSWKNKGQQEIVLKNWEGGYRPDSYSFDRDNLPLLILDYDEIAKRLVDNVLDVLKEGKQVSFKLYKWNGITNAIDNRTLDKLSPIQLTNIVWFVRHKKNMADINLDKKRLFKKRTTEKKIFETLIHHMYKYYETEVVPKALNDNLNL